MTLSWAIKGSHAEAVFYQHVTDTGSRVLKKSPGSKDYYPLPLKHQGCPRLPIPNEPICLCHLHTFYSLFFGQKQPSIFTPLCYLFVAFTCLFCYSDWKVKRSQSSNQHSFHVYLWRIPKRQINRLTVKHKHCDIGLTTFK